MRLSTEQFFSQGITALGDLSKRAKDTQQQISSGERLLSTSDDPVAATRIQQLETQLAVSGQFQRNIDLAETRLSQIEQAISSVEDVVTRVRELVIQSGNGALTNNERRLIAIEIETRQAELEDLVNSRDADGNYIFAGFRVDQQPFERVDGAYQYNGDAGQQVIQIADDASIAISLPGVGLFTDIPLQNNSVRAQTFSPASSSLQVSAAEVSDQALFDANFPEDYIIQFNDINAVVPPAQNYSIRRRSDGGELLANALYDPVAGISFNGFTVQAVGSPLPGDQLLIEGLNKGSVLTTIERIARDMPVQPDGASREAFVNDALENLDAIQDKLLSARAQAGARLNTLETTRSAELDRELGYQEILSDIRDLDYAEAISNLSFLTFTLEAAQQSFARVANLSLFNFLR
ncbi:MAG: flagellar hook-associated protein 3 [Pseudomonadales bacterium]|nr:MAG: flagellar hook-associated protein 3 [Pseudomonadales bacterium]